MPGAIAFVPLGRRAQKPYKGTDDAPTICAAGLVATHFQ